MRILAGDIGGTKTLLQLQEITPAHRSVVLERRYESGLYPTFDGMLSEFLEMEKEPIRAACLAVAGPVIKGRSEITNLHWVIEADALRNRFSIGRVILTNDFSAVAVGVPLLQRTDLLSLNAGNRDLTMPIAILGAGTGLGEAVLVPVGDTWRVVASEGGHADFASQNEEQADLLRVLQRRYGHVSYERVVSGQGLVNIFTFLRDGSFRDHPTAALNEDNDLPASLSKLAGAGDTLALRTFGIFVDAYGAEAGNLALKVLARGGVYLAGGVAAKNRDKFVDGRFMKAFAAKGRFSEFMLDFPVDLITNSNVGLIGALELARKAAVEDESN